MAKTMYQRHPCGGGPKKGRLAAECRMRECLCPLSPKSKQRRHDCYDLSSIIYQLSSNYYYYYHCHYDYEDKKTTALFRATDPTEPTTIIIIYNHYSYLQEGRAAIRGGGAPFVDQSCPRKRGIWLDAVGFGLLEVVRASVNSTTSRPSLLLQDPSTSTTTTSTSTSTRLNLQLQEHHLPCPIDLKSPGGVERRAITEEKHLSPAQ